MGRLATWEVRVHRRDNSVAVSGRIERLAKTAKKDGHVAADVEQVKMRRYLNVAELVPYAVETEGRIGNVARSCVRRQAPGQVEGSRICVSPSFDQFENPVSIAGSPQTS